MADPTVTIRAEMPRDYAAIANLHICAFGNRIGESLIVPLHRQRAVFDPELSLVAVTSGQIVGHALFSPRVIRLLGHDVAAVCLGPIGVHPLWQGRGIGGALIESGHAHARRKGYALSFLVGHDTYYPRFGYIPGVYGWASVRMVPDGTEQIQHPLDTRPPQPEDVAPLVELWRTDENDVDFAIVPDAALTAWLSPDPRVQCRVYLREGRLVGYTRISTAEPEKARLFLAIDGASARMIAAAIARATGTVELPLHPHSLSAQALGQGEVTAWQAAMARPLDASPFDEFWALVQRGERPPGRVIWPAEFDV